MGTKEATGETSLLLQGLTFLTFCRFSFFFFFAVSQHTNSLIFDTKGWIAKDFNLCDHRNRSEEHNRANDNEQSSTIRTDILMVSKWSFYFE